MLGWLAGLLAAASASAATYQQSLARVADQVRQQNPSLVTARLRLREAEARSQQAGLLDNPQLQTGLSSRPSGKEVAFEAAFMHSFPVTSRLRLEKQVSRQQIAVAEAEIADVERRFLAEARTLATKALALRQERRIRERQVEVATKLADFIEDAVSKGEGSPLDAGQARLEAEQLAQQLAHYDLEIHELLHELRPLLGMGVGEEPELEGAFPTIFDVPSETHNPERRPDFQVLLRSLELAGGQLDLERARSRQDWTAGLFTEVSREEDQPIGIETEQRVGFRVTIPLGWRNRNEGNIEAARLAQDRLKVEMVALARAIGISVEAAVHEMESFAAIHQKVQSQLLPLAQVQLERAESAYRNGQANLEQVLRARDQQIKLEVSQLHAARDFHLARLRYEAATGETMGVEQ